MIAEFTSCRLSITATLRTIIVVTCLFGLLVVGPMAAAQATEKSPRLAILQFELNDLTVIPNRPSEIERTQSVAPMLRESLQAIEGLTIVASNEQRYKDANKGFGYLFTRPREAADLAIAENAEWIAVGRVHKPSDLFAYLIVRLTSIKVPDKALEMIVEVKGPSEKVTSRGVRKLTEKIAAAIRNNS